MIDSYIKRLNGCGMNVTGVEISELLWLASRFSYGSAEPTGQPMLPQAAWTADRPSELASTAEEPTSTVAVTLYAGMRTPHTGTRLIQPVDTSTGFSTPRTSPLQQEYSP